MFKLEKWPFIVNKTKDQKHITQKKKVTSLKKYRQIKPCFHCSSPRAASSCFAHSEARALAPPGSSDGLVMDEVHFFQAHNMLGPFHAEQSYGSVRSSALPLGRKWCRAITIFNFSYCCRQVKTVKEALERAEVTYSLFTDSAPFPAHTVLSCWCLPWGGDRGGSRAQTAIRQVLNLSGCDISLEGHFCWNFFFFPANFEYLGLLAFFSPLLSLYLWKRSNLKTQEEAEYRVKPSGSSPSGPPWVFLRTLAPMDISTG